MNYVTMWEELHRYVNANKDAFYNIMKDYSKSATDMSSLEYIVSDQAFRIYANIALKMIELEQQERNKYLKSAIGGYTKKESEVKDNVENN